MQDFSDIPESDFIASNDLAFAFMVLCIQEFVHDSLAGEKCREEFVLPEAQNGEPESGSSRVSRLIAASQQTAVNSTSNCIELVSCGGSSIECRLV